jgi:hypothetical protein
MRQRSKTVVLQCENEVRAIKQLTNEGQLGGIYRRRACINMVRSERGAHKRRKGEFGGG